MPISKKTKPVPKVSKGAPAAIKNPRQLHESKSRWFRRPSTIKRPPRLPSVWQLSHQTVLILWQHRKLFLGLAGIYVLLGIVFVRGLSSGADVDQIKQQTQVLLGGHSTQLVLGITVFSSLLSSVGSSSSASGSAYQVFVVLIISLATIWALRQLLQGDSVRLRDAFYKGMYPLVPFVLVLAVVLIQTLPFLATGALYGFVVVNGIATQLIEQVVVLILFVVGTVVSVYFVSSSLFALYIVTLPDMTPLRALRSVRPLVRYRRGSVILRLIFLPLAIFVLAGIITVPIILVVPPLAPWMLFLLSALGLVASQAYLYNLYRKLLP